MGGGVGLRRAGLNFGYYSFFYCGWGLGWTCDSDSLTAAVRVRGDCEAVLEGRRRTHFRVGSDSEFDGSELSAFKWPGRGRLIIVLGIVAGLCA